MKINPYSDHSINAQWENNTDFSVNYACMEIPHCLEKKEERAGEGFPSEDGWLCVWWVDVWGVSAWGCRIFHSERCKTFWNNQGASQVHVWPALCPTAQIKIADINADGLSLEWKKCVGRLRDDERASSAGSRVIKTHEAEQPWATGGKPLLFRPDLHARVILKQYYSAAS